MLLLTERLMGLGTERELFEVDRLQDAILAAVDRFVGDAAQFDDLTMMTLVREPGS